MPNFLIEISFFNVLIVIKVNVKFSSCKYPEQLNKTEIAIKQLAGET